MRIAIRYCGGCNPRFDRGEIARRIARDFPECEICVDGRGEADYTLVIHGCLRRCGPMGDFVLACPGEYEQLKAQLSELL